MKLTGSTFGELLGPAMTITDQGEADAYFEALVDRVMEIEAARGTPLEREKAAAIQRNNLGYYAGYYDGETMARVNRLYRTRHPIFGDTAPAPAAALHAGRDAAR